MRHQPLRHRARIPGAFRGLAVALRDRAAARTRAPADRRGRRPCRGGARCRLQRPEPHDAPLPQRQRPAAGPLASRYHRATVDLARCLGRILKYNWNSSNYNEMSGGCRKVVAAIEPWEPARRVIRPSQGSLPCVSSACSPSPASVASSRPLLAVIGPNFDGVVVSDIRMPGASGNASTMASKRPEMVFPMFTSRVGTRIALGATLRKRPGN